MRSCCPYGLHICIRVIVGIRCRTFFLFYNKIENIFNWRDDIVVIAASSRYLSYSNADKALPFRVLLALFLENTHRIEVGTDEEVARRGARAI